MKIYKVGGAVRDHLLGIKVTDIDWVVVGASTEEMLAKGFKPVGTNFPVFLDPDNGGEYALARTERKSGRGYGGFVFQASPEVTLEEDLIRRDLTINAIAQDDDGNLIDPYNGQRDLEARILHHVSPAFAEDPLRVLRVARFAARYANLGFIVAQPTQELMCQISESGELEALTPERSWKEISLALMEDQPQVFIQVLRDCGALKILMPEVDALFRVPQPGEHYPELNAGMQTLRVLKQASRHAQPITVRWACLLHDLDRGLAPMDKLQQHISQEDSGLELIKKVNQRFKAPRNCQELALLVGQYHTQGYHPLDLKACNLLELLQNFDVFRRPHRFEEFVVVCEMGAWSSKDLKQQIYTQADYLRGAAHVAHEVEVAPLLEQGLKGPALGEALKIERLKALSSYIELGP